jgi:uncharacterized protein (TIGR00369 family)
MTEAETPVRSKTIVWDDPTAIALAGCGRVGLDFLGSMVDGEVPAPPIGNLLGMALVEVEDGRAVFTLTPDESMFNPIGVVHGGIVCTLLDSALGCALHTTLPAGKGYTSVEIKVSYLKAVQPSSGLLTATGRVVRAGSRVGFTEGEVTDASGALVATATSTLLVFDV